MQTLNDKMLSRRTLAIIMLVVIATILVVSLLIMAQPALADVGDDVAGGISDITKTIRKIVNPIAITATVICGIYMLVGSDPASLKKVKTWLISIIAGLLLVNLAQPLIDWAASIAK